MGGEGASLEAALDYSNVVFAGVVLVWLMNALASVLRGTGNMLVPSLAICAGVVLLVPLSPVLIFGFGPIPAIGIAGGGIAVVRHDSRCPRGAGLVPLVGTQRGAAEAAAAAQGRCSSTSCAWARSAPSARCRPRSCSCSRPPWSAQPSAGASAVAGYGTGARLEYLLIPLVFGLGAPLVALVGTNIGAGQRERALRIALTGGAIAFAMTEAVGLAAAIWPHAWLGLFGDDPMMIETGSAYLRLVGPTYGFFGLGLALYFASQGAGRLRWPLLSGFIRLVIAIGGGWLALRATGSLNALFAALALALVVYGISLATAIRSGVWFTGSRQ